MSLKNMTEAEAERYAQMILAACMGLHGGLAMWDAKLNGVPVVIGGVTQPAANGTRDGKPLFVLYTDEMHDLIEADDFIKVEGPVNK